MAKVLSFCHTDFTLKRRIERACREDEKAMVARALWMLQFDDQGGCYSEEEWESFLEGEYEF
jgi:hypothetical protein